MAVGDRWECLAEKDDANPRVSLINHLPMPLCFLSSKMSMYKPHVDDNDDNNDVESSTSCPAGLLDLRIGSPQHGDSACERIATKSKREIFQCKRLL